VTAALLVGCSAPSPTTAGGGAIPLVLDALPAGYQLAGAAELPRTDLPAGYELSLYSLPGYGNADLAVFQGETDSLAGTQVEAVDLGHGIRGYSAPGLTGDLILGSRSLSDAVLLGLSKSATTKSDFLPDDAALMAHELHSNVPGLGSMPMSFMATGYVVSYARQPLAGDVSGFQRSIAVGEIEAGYNDLDIFDWWFGEPIASTASSRTYVSPAYAVAAGDVAPDATLEVAVSRGLIDMYRTTDEAVGMDWIRSHVRPGTSQDWAAILNEVADKGA
jgi:hypothetical protein